MFLIDPFHPEDDDNCEHSTETWSSFPPTPQRDPEKGQPGEGVGDDWGEYLSAKLDRNQCWGKCSCFCFRGNLPTGVPGDCNNDSVMASQHGVRLKRQVRAFPVSTSAQATLSFRGKVSAVRRDL